jgi:hypothetical protein
LRTSSSNVASVACLISAIGPFLPLLGGSTMSPG